MGIACVIWRCGWCQAEGGELGYLAVSVRYGQKQVFAIADGLGRWSKAVAGGVTACMGLNGERCIKSLGFPCSSGKQ